MSGARFDPTINLGHIITVITFIATFVGGWYVFDYRLNMVEKGIDKLSTLVIENARIDERLKALERR